MLRYCFFPCCPENDKNKGTPSEKIYLLQDKKQKDPFINTYRSVAVDLRKYPHNYNNNNKILILGDLHGNFLKLIYFLLQNGVIEMTKQQYEKITSIYLTDSQSLMANDLKAFNEILKNATLKPARLYLIGDILADRGPNDVLTLFLLVWLVTQKIDLSICYSNHDHLFFQTFHTNAKILLENFEKEEIWFSRVGSSFINLLRLVARSLITLEEIDAIVQKFYVPNLKLYDYIVYGKDAIGIISHAPNGLRTIQVVADALQVKYQDETLEDLKQTIDKINQQFLFYFKSKKLPAEIIQAIHQRYENINDIEKEFPEKNQYKIFHIHGHDEKGWVPKKYIGRIRNLDNILGQYEDNDQGDLTYCEVSNNSNELKPSYLCRIL